MEHIKHEQNILVGPIIYFNPLIIINGLQSYESVYRSINGIKCHLNNFLRGFWDFDVMFPIYQQGRFMYPDLTTRDDSVISDIRCSILTRVSDEDTQRHIFFWMG